MLLLSAMPSITSTAAERHKSLAGTKLYWLVTGARVCKQLDWCQSHSVCCVAVSCFILAVSFVICRKQSRITRMQYQRVTVLSWTVTIRTSCSPTTGPSESLDVRFFCVGNWKSLSRSRRSSVCFFCLAFFPQICIFTSLSVVNAVHCF